MTGSPGSSPEGERRTSTSRTHTGAGLRLSSTRYHVCSRSGPSPGSPVTARGDRVPPELPHALRRRWGPRGRGRARAARRSGPVGTPTWTAQMLAAMATQNAATAAARRDGDEPAGVGALVALGSVGRRALRGRRARWSRAWAASPSSCASRCGARTRTAAGRRSMRLTTVWVFGPTMPSAASPLSACKRGRRRRSAGQSARRLPVARGCSRGVQHALHAPDRDAGLATHAGALGEHRGGLGGGAGGAGATAVVTTAAATSASQHRQGSSPVAERRRVWTPHCYSLRNVSMRRRAVRRGTTWRTHRAALSGDARVRGEVPRG